MDPAPRLPRLRRALSLGSTRWNSVAAVAVGGGLGALARYGLSSAWSVDPPPAFPTVTLIENALGAFLLGLIVTLILEHWPPTRYARPFLAIGVLGGFTTFSTFALENVRLLEEGLPGRAAAYVAITLLAGMFAVHIGVRAARRWPVLLRALGRR